MADRNALTIKIAADGSAAIAGIEQVNKQLAQTGQAAKEATDKIGQGYSSAAKGVRSISEQLSNLQDVMAKGAIAVGAIASIKGMGSALVEAQQSAEKLKNTLEYSVGASMVAAELDYLRNVTRSMGVDFSSASQSYGKFTAAIKGTGITAEQARTIFEGVAGASSKMGLSADETQGAFLALSQMASKGTVSAEELRGQLAERLPGALRIAAQSMGVTDKEFNKLLETGQIMASDFLPKFGQALKDNFQAPLSSLTQEINRLNSAWDQWKQSLANADGGGFKFITTGLNESAAAMRALGNEAGVVHKLLVAIGGFQAGAVGAGKFDTAKIQQDAMAQLEMVIKGRRALESRNLNYLEQESLRDLIRQEQTLRDNLLSLAVQRGEGVSIKPDLKGEFAAQAAKRKEAFSGYMKEVQSEKEKQTAAENDRFKALTATIGTSGKEYETALAAHNAKLSEINKKGAGGAPGLKNDLKEELAARIAMLRDASQREVELIKGRVQAGELTEREGIEKIRVARKKSFSDQYEAQQQLYSAASDKGQRAKYLEEMRRTAIDWSAAETKAQLDVAAATRKASDSYFAAANKENEALDKSIAKGKEELAAIGQTAAQKDLLKQKSFELSAQQADEEAGVYKLAAAYANANADQVGADFYSAAEEAALTRAIKLRSLAEIETQQGVKREAVKAADESSKAWGKFTDDLERSLTDSLYRSFESGKGFGETFITSLKNTLKAAALKLVVQYAVNGTGSLAGAASNAIFGTNFNTGGSNGGGTDYASLVSMGSSAWNMYKGGTGGVAGYGVSAVGNLTGSGTLQAYGAGMQMTAAQSSAAAALYAEAAATATTASANLSLAAVAAEEQGQVALAAYLKAQAAEKTVEAGALSFTGSGLTGGSSAAGTIAWVVAIVMGMKMSSDAWKAGIRWDGTYDFSNDPLKGGPDGLHHERLDTVARAVFGDDFADSEFFAVISGNALSQQVHNMTWGGQKTTGVPDMTGTFSESGAGFSNGRTGQEITEHGGWFTSTKRWWEWQDISPALDKQMDIMYLSISDTLLGVGELFGDSTMLDKIKGFSLDIRTASNGNTFTVVAEQLTEAMGNLFFPSVQALRKAASEDGKTAAESWSQALGRIMQETQAVSRIFDLMGKDLVGTFGKNNADSILKASDNLVTLFGTIDNLNASFGAYYGNFYTAEEQTAQAWKDMGKAFDLVGVALPKTRQEFRSLVDGLDLTTVSGEVTFKRLMDLQSGFAALTPALEDVATAATEIVDLAARKSWGDKLALLKGETTQRELDLAAASDTVVQALMRQVFAHEDFTASLQTDADAIITMYGEVISAMAEINPPAQTLVDSWRESKTELQSLQGVFDQFFGAAIPDAAATIQNLLTNQGGFASGVSTAHGNADNARLQTLTAGQRAEFWRQQEASLWQGLGNSTDKAGTISQIMDAYSNTRAAELDVLTADQAKLNDTTKTGLQTQLDTWNTTLSVIEKAKSFAESLDQFMGSLAFSDLSALGYTDQLSAASALYGKTLNGVNNNDANAIGNFTGNAQDYLKEAQAYYGGASLDYATIYQQVVNDAAGLGLNLNTDSAGAQSEIDRITAALNGLTATLPKGIANEFSSETADGYMRIETALQAGVDSSKSQLDEQKALLQKQIDKQQTVIDNQERQIAQLAATHAQIMAQLDRLNNNAGTTASNSALAATAP